MASCWRQDADGLVQGQEQVARILNAHGESDEAVGDAEPLPLLRRAVRELTDPLAFDIVQVELSDRGDWLKDFTMPAKKVLVFMDLLSVVAGREYHTATQFRAKLWHWFQERKLRKFEQDVALSYDLCITMSEVDTERLGRG